MAALMMWPSSLDLLLEPYSNLEIMKRQRESERERLTNNKIFTEQNFIRSGEDLV